MTGDIDRRNMRTQRDDANERLALQSREMKLLEAEHDRYAKALKQIASENSGVWGDIAFKALRPPITFNDDAD